MLNDPQLSPYPLGYREKSELGFTSSSDPLILDQDKNRGLIEDFLGQKVDRLTATNFPVYYGALLA